LRGHKRLVGKLSPNPGTQILCKICGCAMCHRFVFPSAPALGNFYGNDTKERTGSTVPQGRQGTGFASPPASCDCPAAQRFRVAKRARPLCEKWIFPVRKFDPEVKRTCPLVPANVTRFLLFLLRQAPLRGAVTGTVWACRAPAVAAIILDRSPSGAYGLPILPRHVLE